MQTMRGGLYRDVCLFVCCGSVSEALIWHGKLLEKKGIKNVESYLKPFQVAQDASFLKRKNREKIRRSQQNICQFFMALYLSIKVATFYFLASFLGSISHSHYTTIGCG